MRRIFTNLSMLTMLIFLCSRVALAGGATVEGHIRDSKTGEPLFGANVILVGTAIGGASDLDGKYRIVNVPEGTFSVRVSYLGYNDIKTTLTIKDASTIKKDFMMDAVSLEGKEIVVTGQAYGQKQAINQQLSADQILNAVSAAKIQELPDANVSESIARLPGVAIMRSGGEGNQVIIRGMSPKYNSISIDGVQMASSGKDDRSTDLSMISSNMLDGIQVAKTVTADMDADVMGGAVNFSFHEAKVDETHPYKVGLLAQGSYNGLDNAVNKFNNYKYVGSYETRLLDQLFGVFFQLDVERKNLHSNELGASYIINGADGSGLSSLDDSFILSNISRDRRRTNALLVLDYLVPEGKIKFVNFYSAGQTDISTRKETYIIQIAEPRHEYGTVYNSNKVKVATSALSYEQQMPWFLIDGKLSYTYSESNAPDDWEVTFAQRDNVGLSQFKGMSNLYPLKIVEGCKNNDSLTYLSNVLSNSSLSLERAVTGSLDFVSKININNDVSISLKYGGKYRYQNREYNYYVLDSKGGEGGFNDASVAPVVNLINSTFGFKSAAAGIPYYNFIDPNYSYGSFLGGTYAMGNGANYSMMPSLVNLLKNNLDLIAQNKASIAFSYDDAKSVTNDYSGNETKSAIYIMPTINIGQQVTLIAGLRYQNLKTEYSATQGHSSATSDQAYQRIDTMVTKNHGYWLPSFSVKYKPIEWLDLRASYTNTIAYPDYVSIIPRIYAGTNNQSGFIEYNNVDLKPTRSQNYDVYLSVYNNQIGLFTVGGFYKRIEDLIYQYSFVPIKGTANNYMPSNFRDDGKTIFKVSTYVNNSFVINNYGLELDWQTHFWYLPGVLNGLIFNANYTHIFSKAEYPIQFNKVANRVSYYIDSSYTDRLLNQPNDIVNVSVGFDYSGFSMRVSMLYQTNIFTGTNFWPALRSNTENYTRFDLAIKQDLPWHGMQVYLNLNNLNNAKDKAVNQGNVPVPRSEQDYGMTSDLGLRITL
ncbi:MAG: TonB-dependent receptor [Ignavibacteria bacterium]|nr:TonB-dependent receptor [Ignavibacteria bacterium]